MGMFLLSFFSFPQKWETSVKEQDIIVSKTKQKVYETENPYI